jgi:hypothetical protein
VTSALIVVVVIFDASHDEVHKARSSIAAPALSRRIVIRISRHLVLYRHHSARIDADASLDANVESAHAAKECAEGIPPHDVVAIPTTATATR